jgi:uncharacterized circularly permuted ATP-grasp superfamily protein
MVAPYNEMDDSTGVAREAYNQVREWLDASPTELLQTRSAQAELLFRQIGVTFNVYGDAGGLERLIPFDVVPRVISSAEWPRIEQGLVQRVEALNALLCDLYGSQEILRAGIIPEELVSRNPQLELAVMGHRPAKNVFVHIAGIDLVRTGPDDFYVLEDNARTPSGVSYMLENREVMLRLFPELVAASKIAPVETYPDLLLETLRSVAPDGVEVEPTVVVLTPGPYNSAFYEHSFLAEQMGVELVEGQDLFVEDNHVYMRTIEGPRRVHVIYRRVDDAYLDPLFFRPDSTATCQRSFASIQGGTQSWRMSRPGAAGRRSICRMCWIICLNSSSRRSMGPAAMGCSSARTPRRRKSPSSPPSYARTLKASSHSPRWRCLPALPFTKAAPRPATWTFDPLS